MNLKYHFGCHNYYRNIQPYARNCSNRKVCRTYGKFMDLSEVIPVSNLIETILKDTGYLRAWKVGEIEDKSRIET